MGGMELGAVFKGNVTPLTSMTWIPRKKKGVIGGFVLLGWLSFSL